ncbi:polysaccharide deacetylase family protein [Streptomyces parvulus]|uniref:Oligosaccharide deacetylase n=1 Tax=Streptomyces parvulus TaxID=146923 RepID=A0A191V6W0_9ACTN|nr:MULTISPECIES: polysaccharide deacetylase family protein [Streptomyces]ANJ10655.1 oligosaccharide deacetylase [Streptomyces parvulus]MCC9155398.1 polysaccharide deacetylase family protein [Streptomyces parvulus]MCE7687652.1 polysaccharide deacetylase family protein [Streptomyces parvulus]MCQ4195819.1 polysaccharide deacetylase family protein [Streptomyces parvulus]WML83810.1 polysaccharide deacetylase family protein [Streptomyces sp. VNUA74]
MKKDQLLSRRGLLAGAACAAAAGTAGALAVGLPDGPARPAAPAPGAPGRSPLKPSAYRLQPLTGYGAPGAAPGRPPVRSEPILRMTGRGRTMLLTFDDGPHPDYTPDILDTLAEYDVRATFFVCGEMADFNRDLISRMADEGHVVGNHTWSHPLLTSLSRRRIRSEMERTSEVVDKACGEPPRWFRAPYGAWNRNAFRIGADLGMEPLAWTVDTLDWTTPGTRTIVDRVEDGAAPGVVVLSHDAGGDRSQSVRALRRYLPRLLDDGYHLTVPRRSHV